MIIEYHVIIVTVLKVLKVRNIKKFCKERSLARVTRGRNSCVSISDGDAISEKGLHNKIFNCVNVAFECRGSFFVNMKMSLRNSWCLLTYLQESRSIWLTSLKFRPWLLRLSRFGCSSQGLLLLNLITY